MWFGPHPEFRLDDLAKGSADFLDLFPSDALWTMAAGRVQVFKVLPGFGLGPNPPEDSVRLILDGIAERGMALAIEVGPLPHPLAGGSNTTCGDGVEGFSGPFALQDIQKVVDAGGTIDAVSFDEPLAFGHFFDGPEACQWPLERVASETAAFVEAVRAVSPNAIFGDIEPAWASPEIDAEDIGAWLDAYRAAVGEPLGYFHLDVDWARRDWASVAKEIEDVVRSRGVPFGIIYNGGDTTGSNEEWLQLTIERAYEYEQVTGGRPDHVIFQSWHYYPTRVLPETDRGAFTSVIDRYFGARTALEPTALDQVTLRTTDGVRMAGASLEVEAVPIDGPYQEFSLNGVVPPDASSAVVVVRVNTEGAGPGEAGFSVYEITYAEDGGENLVQNSDFGQGMVGWGQSGDAEASIVASDLGAGQMLHVVASPDQALYWDSAEFPITPGTAFELHVAAAVPLASADSAYAGVVFLGAEENGRRIIPMSPAPIELGQVTTDTNGQATIVLSAVDPGRYLLRVHYVGDLETWPCRLEQEIEL